MRRYHASKFIYPVFYLTRRMILAIACVFLWHEPTAVWLIWLLLSLGQIFVLAKFEPFGDRWMNRVQVINEAFIFFALILLMPLANNLTDLQDRDNVGWCLYGVLCLCILFNIIILLLRSLTLLCSYYSARKKIYDHIKQVEIDPHTPDTSNPFIRPHIDPGSPIRIRRKPMPVVRDHATFGMVSGTVMGSMTSLYD